VPAGALAFALAAACAHALWNLLLARARDPEVATAVALVFAAENSGHRGEWVRPGSPPFARGLARYRR
jgi:hypothetical protein